ncbi:MAG: hypothetical protein Q9208_002866 [Pyrenodesmia sp. 3 TL-2023]
MAPFNVGVNRHLQVLTILSVIVAAIAGCYYPNGTDRNEGFPRDIYLPINPGDEFSMCCSSLGDKPRSDGLCENAEGSVIWRESCTDRTWQSPKCIKLCADSSPGNMESLLPAKDSKLIRFIDTNNSPGVGRQMDNDEQVTPCTDGSYCCGDGSLGFDCCNEGRGVFVRDGTTQNANPSSTSASSTPSSSTDGSTTTPPTSASVSADQRTAAPSLAPTLTPTAATTPEGSKVDAGAVAGGVVGGLAGLVFIVVGAWYLLFKRRKGTKTMQDDMAQLQEFPSTYHGAHTRSYPQEAQGSYTEEYKRSELPAGLVDGTMGKSELDNKSIPTTQSR